MQKNLVLITNDGKHISVKEYNTANPIGWVVLLHMMPSTKESYNNLAEKMQKLGYYCISFDFRGHGMSESGPNGYKFFTDEEHKNKIKDLEAVVDYIRKISIKDVKLTLVGASIEANIALAFASQNKAIENIILLSPGIDYRSVKAIEYSKKLSDGQRVLIVSSEDDFDNKSESEEIFESIPDKVIKYKIVFKKAGHGTNILINEPKVVDRIIDFIKIK